MIVINLCWQFFRAWMPKMLREQYRYSAEQVQYFSIAYYVAADVGCLVDRVLDEVAGGPGLLGPRSADDDLPGLLAPDGIERAGRRACRPRGCCWPCCW